MRFIALCHALSGGLPRDLLRTTRHLYELPLPTTLEDAARHLVNRELRGKVSLLAVAMHGSTFHPWNDIFAVWSDQIETIDSADDLLRAACELATLTRRAASAGSDDESASSTILQASTEMATFVYYCATMLSICSANSAIRNEKPSTAISLLADLAQVRQAFSSHISLAWSRIDNIRRTAGWNVLDHPRWRSI
jgi:hypothetical protein